MEKTPIFMSAASLSPICRHIEPGAEGSVADRLWFAMGAAPTVVKQIA
jgi:hypothetical protein